VVVEFARQELPVFGFTWGQLAQSQHNAEWLLKIAGLAGGWGIAFLLVTVNGLLVGAVTERPLRTRLAYAGVAALLLLGPALIPRRNVNDTAGTSRVAIVQGNVPRDFIGTIAAKNVEIINSHARLTRSLAGQDIDVVVWPESSVGLDMRRIATVRQAVETATQTVGAEMIVGANEDAGPGYKVMAYHLDPTGQIVDTYQKTHLVPFGEYVPWRDLFGRLSILDQVSRDAQPGDTPKVFMTQSGPVAPVISFEGDFGSLVRERIGSTGGRMLVVATNTSTWATSWASAQHLAFSQVRAAENGVFVAHAALSGISAFIDPSGSVLDKTELWTEEILVGTVGFASEPTFYARVGDWLVVICALVSIGACLAWFKRRPGTVE
jgi:apolipoprotein N-acyltransferase